MIDVDHFKKFNDTHGHDIGDQVLRLVAARLAAVGGGGRAFRYGGEEFPIIFPGRRLARALAHTEALRRDIERYEFEIRSRDRRQSAGGGSHAASVTVSIGVASTIAGEESLDTLLRRADGALYAAKNGGRNRVAH